MQSIAPLAGPNNDAIDFFWRFAQMEYALKATSFRNGNDRRVEADWTSFAKAVEAKFCAETDAEFVHAIEYMLATPPKKQIVKDGRLDWADSVPSTNSTADRVLIYVRRVRNNLFHGGKFNGRWFAPERSEDLIKHSRIIIEKVTVHRLDRFLLEN